MNKNAFRLVITIVPVAAIALSIALAQNAPAPQSAPATAGAHPALPPLPPPQYVPKPGPATDEPYQPLALMPGGVVVTLFPPGSPYLNMARIKEPEVYNMSGAVPGRVSSIVNIHNPSIEFHSVDRGLNTGAVMILAAGGGHNTLNVGGEACDFVPFFYNYGVNTVILRNRLRRDGYNPQTDEVYDAQQAVRLVRAHAKDWNLDPNKIGIMGFSAGAELSAPAAVQYEEFDKKNSDPSDPLAGISSRPISYALFIRVLRPSREAVRHLQFREMRRLHSSLARLQAITSTRNGHSIIFRQCSPCGFRTLKFTSMRRVNTPATGSTTAAACRAA